MVANRTPIAVSMCHRCRKIPVTRFKCCDDCRKAEVKRIEKVRQDALAEGYCTICRKQEFEAGTVTCGDCKQRSIGYSRARRAECKKTGTCYQCLQRPVRKEPPATACQSCLDRRARQHRAKVLAERAAMRRDAPERIVEALELHSGELDVYGLAEQVGMTTRHVLRLLRPLVAEGRVRRREDEEVDGTNVVAKYSFRERRVVR